MTSTVTEIPNDKPYLASSQDGDSDRSPAVEPLFRRLQELTEHDPERAALLDRVVAEYLPLAQHLARRFAGRGESLEDLVQVASVGLIKAIDRFDPDRGVPFEGFALPTITGELRRHFRDAGWDVRVPRRLQELNRRIRLAVDELSQRHNKAPTATELASYLQLPREEIIEGLQAGQAYTSASLDLPAGPDADGLSLGETLGADDLGMEAVDNHETLKPLLGRLPERERRILHLRFVRELTQSQIAQEIGVSQMHVSRLLSTTLVHLRAGMLA